MDDRPAIGTNLPKLSKQGQTAVLHAGHPPEAQRPVLRTPFSILRVGSANQGRLAAKRVDTAPDSRADIAAIERTDHSERPELAIEITS